MLTQELLKELVTYDPDTGVMRWRGRTEKYTKKLSVEDWNIRYSGKEIRNITASGTYRIIHMDKSYPLARLAWLYVYGEYPDSVNHINLDKADNRIINLHKVLKRDNKSIVITQAILKELVTYNPETGVMIWKERTSKYIEKDSSRKCWNTNHSGNEINNLDLDGYYLGSFFNKTYKVHRMIWLYIHGEMPDQIDHINGKPSDNRLVNLQNVTTQQNSRNQKMNCVNTSGVTGVIFIKKFNVWRAKITCNRKVIDLGTHTTLFDATCHRKSAELRLGFSLRHGTKQN